MKLTKRILSLILALVMMSGVLAVSASAATAKTVRQYKTYTALGDSIGAGFSMPDFDRRGSMYIYKERIEGSYTSLIADDVQANKFYPMCYPGYRTTELRVMLDDSYNGDSVTNKYIEQIASVPYGGDEIRAQRKEAQYKVSHSDLVTLECGSNDTWLFFGAIANLIMDGSPLDDSYEGVIKDFLDNFDSLGEALYTAYNLAMAVPYSPVMVAQAVQLFASWLPQYARDYRALVAKIYELNPNVTIVATSVWNPMRTWELPEGSGLTLLQLLNPEFDIMNSVKSSLVDQYPGKYYYVDVTDVETRTQSLSQLQAEGYDPHPTAAGHKYIEKKILEQLPTGKRASNWKRTDVNPPLFSKGSSGWGVYDSYGALRPGYDGIARSSSGKLYYVKDGLWAKSFSGVVYDYGTKKRYYIKNGKVDTSYSGKMSTKSYTYTIKNGVVTSRTKK